MDEVGGRSICDGWLMVPNKAASSGGNKLRDCINGLNGEKKNSTLHYDDGKKDFNMAGHVVSMSMRLLNRRESRSSAINSEGRAEESNNRVLFVCQRKECHGIR